MKNIHVLPTDLPSRLYLHSNNELQLRTNIIRTSEDYLGTNQNIYITNLEKPKARDWVLGDFPDNPIGKVISKYGQEFTVQSLNGDKYGLAEYDSKKIILTTDPDLIANGVQSIDDEFLKWFVAHPSCERVEVSYGILKPFQSTDKGYMIHLPDTVALEEPKPHGFCETPEEKCTMNYCDDNGCQNRKRQLTDLEIAIKLEEIEREEWKQETLVEKMIPLQLKYNLDNMKQKAIEEAAKSYRSSTANKMAIEEVAFQEGAKSDAAKDYWYSQFQEQDKNKFSEEDMIAFGWFCREKSLTMVELLIDKFKNQEDGND
jgi:hypothetical protein